MKNFVYVIGYQFEKVHTGMIKWLLDWDNTEISKSDKLKIIDNFYKFSNNELPFNLTSVNNISCTPENSFGRGLKIDLVIKLDLENGAEHFLVMEMKVDSIPYEDQLKRTQETFDSQMISNEDDVYADYFLLLLGSSFACDSPEKRYGFSYLKLCDIISIFSDLDIDDHLYNDWIFSLKEEMGRYENVIENIDLLTGDSIWNEDYWLKKHYRIYFPLFYYIYDNMRKKYLDRESSWPIYSGSNNPVMNWDDGWLGNEEKEFQFYWEFNYESFILKIWIDRSKMNRDQLNKIRDQVYPICENTKHRRGSRTYRRYAEWNSIFKWDFNFKEESFQEIAKAVDNDILTIHTELKTWLQSYGRLN